MTQTTAPAVLRLTLRGPAGAVDIAAPVDATPRDVQQGAPLARVTGRPLEQQTPLRQQGIHDGDVLVLLPVRTTYGSRPDSAIPAASSTNVGPAALIAAAIALLGSAALVAAVADPGPPRTVVALALVLTAVGCTAAEPTALLAPGLAAAGAFVLVAGPGPGADRLAPAVAGVAAAQAAALARLRWPADDRHTVWLAAWSLVAVTFGLVLLAGAPAGTAWAVFAGLAVLAVRLLPALVIHVPEDALLDIDHRAVHVRPPHRHAEVAEVVTRAQRLLAPGSVATGALAAVATTALTHASGAGSARLGTGLLALCVGGALVLGARTHRGRSRFALRAGGAAALTAVVGAALMQVAHAGLWAIALGSAVVAAGAIVAAVALGRGWRSLWWGRVADLASGLAVTASVPAAMVAAGGFEYVRHVVS